MSYKKIFISLFFIAYNLTGWAQYRVELKMDGANDSMVYLMNYTAQGRNIMSSVRANRKGNAVFADKQNNLEQGMYVIQSCGEEFPFLVSNRALFELTVDADASYPELLTYRDSKENEYFLKYLNYEVKYKGILQKVQSTYNYQNSEVQAAIDILLDTLRLEREQFVDIIVSKYKGSLLASVIMASQEPEMQQIATTGNIPLPDSVRKQRMSAFIRAHFFDNVDFSDTRLINTPILPMRLDVFFGEVLQNEITSKVIAAANNLLDRVQNNPEMYRYILTWLYRYYNTSSSEHYAVGKAITNIMTDSAKVNWLTEADKKELHKNVKRYSLNPVGGIAADLALQTHNGAHKSLHAVKAPCTLLYFFSPDCYTCQIVTPMLYSLYQKYKNKGLQVFAVYPDREKKAWVKYINDNNYREFINVWDSNETAHIYDKYSLHVLPQVYVLDADKKILYKDVSIDDLQNILFIAFLNKPDVEN